MKGLSIIINLIIFTYSVNALKLEIQNKNVNNFKILKDFPVKEHEFFIFQYTFNGGSSDLNDNHYMVFAVHRKDKPIENFILISGKNSEVIYNNNSPVYMRLHNLEKTVLYLTLDLEFSDFADGMELSIYYFEIGNIYNRKNFIINPDRFQHNKILTKSIKIIKMRDPKISNVSPVDDINNQGNVWNLSLLWVLALFCIILPIFHFVIIVLHLFCIKINRNKNTNTLTPNPIIMNRVVNP